MQETSIKELKRVIEFGTENIRAARARLCDPSDELRISVADFNQVVAQEQRRVVALIGEDSLKMLGIILNPNTKC